MGPLRGHPTVLFPPRPSCFTAMMIRLAPTLPHPFWPRIAADTVWSPSPLVPSLRSKTDFPLAPVAFICQGPPPRPCSFCFQTNCPPTDLALPAGELLDAPLRKPPEIHKAQRDVIVDKGDLFKSRFITGAPGSGALGSLSHLSARWVNNSTGIRQHPVGVAFPFEPLNT